MIACTLALAMAASSPAHAALLEVSPPPVPQARLAPANGASRADLSLVRGAPVVARSSLPSQLPEPEVFAMMLLGLILIGYRASRHSDEKFE